MTLREARCSFTALLPGLLNRAQALGYEVAVDQVKRTQAEADANAASGAGIKNSLHLVGLAVDILLYKNGLYLDGAEGYDALGVYWRNQSGTNSYGDVECCWGGDFTKLKDYGHFSIAWGGRK